jgi:tetratricopeptide (TPR) repeat protein
VLTTTAQKISKLFDHGLELYRDKEYDSALLVFEKVYNEGRGNFNLINKSYYNIAQIYLEKNDIKKAKALFTEIIGSSEFDDMEEGGLGSGLMADPYALYKNHSCNIMAHLALEEYHYKEALSFVEMADKIYPFRHYCGNAYESYAVYLATMYAKCYIGMGNREKAIGMLLPECFNSIYADNSDLIKLLVPLLKSKYDSGTIKEMVDHALTNITSKKTGKGKHSGIVYVTTLFGTEFILNNTGVDIDYRKLSNLEERDQVIYCFGNERLIKALLAN